MKKESNYKFSPILLALFILLFTLLSLQDQLAINNSSKKNSAILAAGYEAYELNLKEEMGIDTKPINGADIYNGRCIACHRFDVKVVGPPYNQTLPKYEGKKAELVSFIMNPVKKNPDYPAMPNQGLKPKEAEAVADYLLNTYKKQ
jgi:cytochrome c